MAKPKLALIPAAQGDKFYSVLPSDGVGDFDFTRNSSATRIASTGFIETVESYGSELILNVSKNSTFNDATTNWASQGNHTATVESNELKVVATGAGGTSSDATTLLSNTYVGTLTNGKTYKYSFSCRALSGTPTLKVRPPFEMSPSTEDIVLTNVMTEYTIIGQRINFDNAFFSLLGAGTFYIDNVSVKEVIGKSRLNYDLLNGKVVNCPHYLLEPARTNVMLQSNQFDTTWAFTRASVSQGYLSPDGSLNAWAFIDNATDSTHLMVQSASLGAVTSTASMYVKAGTRDFVAFRFEGNTGVDYVYFDVKNGIIGDVNSDYIDVSMENAGNGWYRCIATRVLAASGNQFIVLSANANGDPTYAGNGDNALYIFGAQVEEGSYPTSYIPTNGTAITRAAETANGSGNAATFNDSEGVLMAEISALANDLTNRRITIDDGTGNNRIILGYYSLSNSILIDIASQGTGAYTKVAYVPAVTNFNKIALKYKENDFALWVNGLEIDVDLSGITPINLNNLKFDGGSGAVPFYGNTRELQYFDSALTDAQLETLTSWTSLQEMITSQLYTNY